jgi:hypothetical protein
VKGERMRRRRGRKRRRRKRRRRRKKKEEEEEEGKEDGEDDNGVDSDDDSVISSKFCFKLFSLSSSISFLCLIRALFNSSNEDIFIVSFSLFSLFFRLKFLKFPANFVLSHIIQSLIKRLFSK